MVVPCLSRSCGKTKSAKCETCNFEIESFYIIYEAKFVFLSPRCEKKQLIKDWCCYRSSI